MSIKDDLIILTTRWEKSAEKSRAMAIRGKDSQELFITERLFTEHHVLQSCADEVWRILKKEE